MKKSLALASLVLTIAGSTLATPRYVKREHEQQKRIAQGIRSGSLTAGEAARIEMKEQRLNNEVKDMRRIQNGRLTTADKRIINQQQNVLSKDIHREKHD